MVPLKDALETFIENLYFFITSNNVSYQCNALIRKHSESLKKLGDLSFPAVIKPWLPHFSKEIFRDYTEFEKHFEKCFELSTLNNANKKCCLTIVYFVNTSNRINLFIDRPTAFKAGLMQCLENGNITRSKLDNKEFKISMDITQKSEDSLANSRVRLVKDFIENVSALSLQNKELQVVVTSRSSYKPTNGAHIVLCGTVLNVKTSAKEVNISAEDYIKKRQTEMTLIAQHKYGVRTANSAGWEVVMRRLGKAAVTFELLQTRPGAAVKINFDQPTAGCSKGAAFVLYNCARLETLLRTHQEKVDNGEYPQLPGIEDIDFSLLSDEDEWSLLWNYVLTFPGLVKGCLRVDGDTLVVSPHNVCGYLSSLVRVFSQYYRRVRILVEGRAHLLPVVHARIHLLKSLQVVMRSSLDLLGIDFVSRM